ncbi:unnamed protein product [Ambrosiozyma monospora]|uniref:Unnamed protein product n=1 Tax=Ambrosiozyma monospora TaxID=43982 RepID=A0ACB5T5C1_AMBMO|nr:unnamed protein product [Ambrosiozyma monospora]
MSAQQFKLSWIDYQDYLTKKLTLNTVGTAFETRTPLAITLSSARKSHLAPVYHYASQAHNNHFFFQQLKDASETEVKPEDIIKPQLLKMINNSFENLENFKNTFLYAADTLSGNGWVFLVEDEYKNLKIIQCNNDGTPYLYSKNQSIDLNGAIDLADYEKLISHEEKLANKVKDYSLPLLAVNVWEQAYVEDYGVTGKADYLENFWKCIDWEVVNKRLFSA